MHYFRDTYAFLRLYYSPTNLRLSLGLMLNRGENIYLDSLIFLSFVFQVESVFLKWKLILFLFKYFDFL